MYIKTTSKEVDCWMYTWGVGKKKKRERLGKAKS